MSALIRESSVLWSVVLVVVLPLVIIAAGEIEERLRQRDSAFVSALAITRTAVLPLLVLWALLRALVGLETDTLVMRIVGTALVLSAAAAATSVLRVVVVWLRGRPAEGHRAVPRLILALPRLLLVLFTVWFLVAGVWGVNLSAALTALGVSSLVVSLALQDTLSGVASGFLLLSDQPFQPGDWIATGDAAGGIEGRVIDVNWRSSRIEDRNGDLQVVPNSQLAGGVITNYDEPTHLHRIVVPVQVAFVNPPNVAIDMLIAAAQAAPGVLADPPPTARVVQVDDPLMGYEIYAWIDDFTIAPQVASDVGALVWYQSERDGVPLPSPAQDLYLYDGIQASAPRHGLSDVEDRLRTSPDLAQLGPADLDALAGAGRPQRFARHETIVGPGLPREDLFVIWTGTARLTVDGPDAEPIPVADLGPGEIFGLLHLGGDPSRSSTVTATSDCEVIAVRADEAAAVTTRNPGLAVVINRLAASRRRRIERLLDRAERSLPGPEDDADPRAPVTPA